MLRQPEANIEVYIDDLSIEIHSDRDDALVELMADVVLDIKESLTQHPGLEDADGKTCVGAYNEVAAKRVAKPVAKLVGNADAVVAQTRHLGADYTACTKSSNRDSVQSDRLAKAKTKTLH